MDEHKTMMVMEVMVMVMILMTAHRCAVHARCMYCGMAMSIPLFLTGIAPQTRNTEH